MEGMIASEVESRKEKMKEMRGGGALRGREDGRVGLTESQVVRSRGRGTDQ